MLEKSELRSAKRVLGLGNVFPMFIAVAYAAGGRTTLLTLSASHPSAAGVWGVGGGSDGAEKS